MNLYEVIHKRQSNIYLNSKNMKRIFTKAAMFSIMALGLALVACTSKAPVKEQQSEESATIAPDDSLVVAADSHLKAHQEDIHALWDSYFEGKEISKYALAKNYVFLSTQDGNDGLLLSFYKDMKDIDNFDGIAVGEGQELTFQGDALVIKEKTDAGDKTTYYEKTEQEGFNQLFTVTEKDGQKTYTDDVDEPYDEKEAQDFINKISNATASSLADVLSSWIDL